MLTLPARWTKHLWRYRTHGIAVRRSRRNAALVHLSSEGILCNLRARSYNRREGSVTYEFVVANRGAVPIVCRLYGIDGDAHTHEYGMLAVPAGSAANSLLLLPLEDSRKRKLYVEVLGENVNLFAETFAVSVRGDRPWPAVPFVGLVFTTLVAIGATYFLVRPSVAVYGIPATTRPGVVRGGYVLGGIGDATYRVRLSDGSTLAHGNLSARAGGLTFVVPPRAVGHVATLSVVSDGVLGRAERVDGIVVDRSGISTAPSFPRTPE